MMMMMMMRKIRHNGRNIRKNKEETLNLEKHVDHKVQPSKWMLIINLNPFLETYFSAVFLGHVDHELKPSKNMIM